MKTNISIISLINSIDPRKYIENINLLDNEKCIIFGNKGFLIYQKNNINNYYLYKNIIKIGKVSISKDIIYNISDSILNRYITYIPKFTIFTSDGDYHTIYDDENLKINLYVYHKIKFKEIKNFKDFFKWIFKNNYIINPKIDTIKSTNEYQTLSNNLENIRYKLISAIELGN